MVVTPVSGAGRFRPASRSSARCKAIASRINRSTVSRVSPTAMHPGRSGTDAPYDVGPRSITTAYFMRGLPARVGGRHEHRPERAGRELGAQVAHDRHDARSQEMTELSELRRLANRQPAVVFEVSYQFTYAHTRSALKRARAIPSPRRRFIPAVDVARRQIRAGRWTFARTSYVIVAPIVSSISRVPTAARRTVRRWTQRPTRSSSSWRTRPNRTRTMGRRPAPSAAESRPRRA